MEHIHHIMMVSSTGDNINIIYNYSFTKRRYNYGNFKEI
ncbi:hypothetical protein COPEUT_01746 [Coprococcus eutactus ATCC 27759]|nr:hypothetical protein COPEUT_01746 [Coprococcus eutactus ATCC 27759]